MFCGVSPHCAPGTALLDGSISILTSARQATKEEAVGMAQAARDKGQQTADRTSRQLGHFEVAWLCTKYRTEAGVSDGQSLKNLPSSSGNGRVPTADFVTSEALYVAGRCWLHCATMTACGMLTVSASMMCVRTPSAASY